MAGGVVGGLTAAVRAGDRAAGAKAITRVESTHPRHRSQAREFLVELTADLAGRPLVSRVAISGVPGVGKSTFIESLGMSLIEAGHRVGVLTVDPSSVRTGGSVLGDKTRMLRLATNSAAYIRPSPSAGTLGGVARATAAAITVLEAAGFDVVLVETVGVGQSETAVADMTDLFVLIHAPGGGDELQGVKRGIMELADMVVVNKADGDLLPAARRSAADLKGALHLMRPKHKGWTVPVLLVSALEEKGIAEVWAGIGEFRALLGESGLKAARQEQALAWMAAALRDGLLAALAADEDIAKETQRLEADVSAGRITPPAAAERLLARFLQT